MSEFKPRLDVEPLEISGTDLKRVRAIAARQRAEAKQDQFILAKDKQSILPLINSLWRYNSANVISIAGANRGRFKRALDTSVEEKDGKIAWLSARGNIQAKALDDADAELALGAISQVYRSKLGLNVVVFDDVDFNNRSHGGTPRVINRIRELIINERRQGLSNMLRQNVGLSFVALGYGRPADLPSHPNHNHSGVDPTLAMFDGPSFALTPDMSLATSYVPEASGIKYAKPATLAERVAKNINLQSPFEIDRKKL
jgi:hypothetical protein